MQNTKSHRSIVLLSLLLAFPPQLQQGLAQGTAFIYQGRLHDGLSPGNGSYDLSFAVYDSTNSPGSVMAGPLIHSGTAVANGLFSVTLDFGANVFTGADRWLEIAVRTNAGGNFTTLAPRQKFTPTPYAITAANVTGPVPTSALTGTVAEGQLPANIARLNAHQTFTGTNVFLANVGLGTSATSNRLEVADVQARARMTSSGLDGSALELGSANEDPSTLGSIDFTHTTGLFGQIAYSWSGMDFMTAHRQRMHIDASGNIGIGTTSPAWPLHLVAAQSVARLDSTANGFGSVLELRNDTASPAYLGAINFNNAAGTYPGQIGYTGDNSMVFRTSGTERMRIMATGGVGIGTASPVEALHVERSQASVRVTSTSSTNTGSLLQLINTTPNATAIGGIVMMGNDSGESATLRLENAYGDSAVVPYLRLIIGSFEIASFGREVNGIELNASTTITSGGPLPPAAVNKTGSDGVLIALQRDHFAKGTISVSGETVSYNAFTGSHFAWTDQALQRGQLVRMTGVNRRFGDRPESEVVYGIASTVQANDPACLGAYLALQEPTQPAGVTNPHLVMAVGNGDLWVVDSGGDIEPGDSLISSEVEGCAMKDVPARFAIGHVVARAAERVVWSEVPADADGLKRRLISVLFGPFVRGARENPTAPADADAVARAAIQGLNRKLAEELKRRDAEDAKLTAELRAIKIRLDELTTSKH